MTDTKQVWTAKVKPTCTDYENPLFDGLRSIFVCTSCYKGSKGIDCYDCKNDELKTIKQYPKNIQSSHSTCVFDDKKNMVYIFGGYCQTFAKFNILNKEFENLNQIYQNDAKYNVIDIGTYPSSILVNDIWHILGGNRNNHHIILNLNDESPKFKKIYQFKDFEGNLGSRIIYSDHTNQLIWMGGCDHPNYYDTIYTLNNPNETNVKWQKVKQKLPKKLSHFGVIIFKKYIIVFGGMVDGNYSDSIYFCEINTFLWNKSQIKCPNKCRYYAILTNEKTEKQKWILFGFLRRISSINIPNDIINAMSKFYSPKNKVHLFGYYSIHSHHVIDPNHIIFDGKNMLSWLDETE